MNEILDKTKDGTIIQYLTFSVDDENYALKITKVQEVMRLPQITRLPKAPVFIKGVINVRGTIIPIIDLREKFDLESRDYTETTRIIVVDLIEKHIGIVVDDVSRVIRVPESNIKPPPPDFSGMNQIISGEIELDNELIIILSIEKLLSENELLVLSQVKESIVDENPVSVDA